MSLDETILSVAQTVPVTEAEGPGVRFALWFQGCPLRCPGCCNPEFLPFNGGESKSLSEMLAWIDRTPGIEGITLLGGEPFAHAEAAAALSMAVHERGLTVMVFSGYTLEELKLNPSPHVANLLSATDLLIDGPYIS